MINKYFLAKMNIPAYLKKFLYNRYYGYIIEGIPPITFQGNGKYLLDYRIYGAVGGVGDKTNNLFDGIFLHRSVIGNEVGTDDVNRRSIAIDISNYNNGEKITFSRETAVGSVFQMYQVSSTQTGGKLCNESVVSGNSNTRLATITITKVNEYPYLMIFLNGANKPIKDEDLIASKIMINVGNTALPYEPYGYKVPVVVGGKNLLQNTASSQTINGVTFTVNNDGSIICNGTSSAVTTFAISIKLNSNINYALSGSPKNGGFATYRFDLRNISYSVYNNIVDNGDGINFTVEENGTYLVCIRIAANYTCNNLTFYPMIRLASIQDDTYEPYHEPTTTNIYLDKPIEENESISLSDTNVNIPTIRGTNVLTVDTTIQPSKVLIKVGG